MGKPRESLAAPTLTPAAVDLLPRFRISASSVVFCNRKVLRTRHRSRPRVSRRTKRAHRVLDSRSMGNVAFCEPIPEPLHARVSIVATAAGCRL